MLSEDLHVQALMANKTRTRTFPLRKREFYAFLFVNFEFTVFWFRSNSSPSYFHCIICWFICPHSHLLSKLQSLAFFSLCMVVFPIPLLLFLAYLKFLSELPSAIFVFFPFSSFLICDS